MSRIDAPLGPDKTIELGHHVLKAHIYKSVSKQRGFSSRDMQAYWMALSSDDLSAALVAQHNLYTPNVKVSGWKAREVGEGEPEWRWVNGKQPFVKKECVKDP